ncbi:hypothetical protein N7530_006366 [Penicillium desertorum]|uniref:Toxin biosynthesis protein n=1 Tax=Penicillium desertorum TaxID=1303715 RepID=A0A9W9WRK1_9EURO|nr:hypothetical protein N7530_006366 [Penicillium desertorum]
MPSSTPGPFHIVEHRVPCQHIREYPGETLDTQEDVLHLSVKQYIPWDNLNPQPGDVTIVGAHANAFPKELYEPLWEEIICHAKTSGFRIRAIWIADVAHRGQSAVLNESVLGNDPSWFDHSRDLVNLLNIKRADMPPPMDLRVLQNRVKYGLRDISSPHPLDDKFHGTKNPPVFLATSRYEDATSFARPYYDNSTVAENNLANRTVSHLDLDPTLVTSFPFYLPGPSQLFDQLPNVRPSVLYVFAGKSPMCLPALCKDKLSHTGTGIGGSSGFAAGRVRSTYMEGFGHMVAQEAQNKCAKRAARWIGPEIKRWQDENSLVTTAWPQKRSSKERGFYPIGMKSRF